MKRYVYSSLLSCWRLNYMHSHNWRSCLHGGNSGGIGSGVAFGFENTRTGINGWKRSWHWSLGWWGI